MRSNPGDFDACWDPTGVNGALLRALAPALLDLAFPRAAQKAHYAGEFFPSTIPAEASGRLFLDFFQVDMHTGEPKGIVVLELGEMP